MSEEARGQEGLANASQEPDKRPASRRRTRRIMALGVLGLIIVGALVAGSVWLNRETIVVELPDIPLDGVNPSIVEAVTRQLDAVTEEPDSGGAWGKLGMVLYAHEFIVESIDCFAVAQELDPEDYRWPYLRGMVLGEMDPAHGLPFIRQALDLDPANLSLRLRLAEFLLDLRELEESEQTFRRVLQAAREHPRAQLGLARLAAMRGDDEEAIRFASQAALGAPSIRPTHELLAQLYHRNGEAKAAELQLQMAQELSTEKLMWPDPVLAEVVLLRADTIWQNEQAHQFLMQGQPEKYIRALQDLISKYPERPSLYLQLIRTLLKMGNVPAARSVMQDALRRCPDSIELKYLWGVIHTNMREHEKAAEIFREVVELKPDYPEAHFSLAASLRTMKDPAGAIQSLREVLQYEPFSVDAHVELAELLLEAKQREEAIKHLRTALELSPNHAGALRVLGQTKTD
jgi:tetratricopeptide (TPR) repeat protein